MTTNYTARSAITTSYTERIKPAITFIMTELLDFLMTEDDNYLITDESKQITYTTRPII